MKARTLFLSLVICFDVSCAARHERVRVEQPDEVQAAPARSAQESKATKKISQADPTQDLKATAERVWKARAARDCKIVAQYYDPNEYMANTQDERVEICEKDPFRYVKYQIGKVEVEGRYGWAQVTYEAKYAPYEAEPAQPVDTIEKWKRINDVWYPVPARILETCPDLPSKRDAAEEARLRDRFEKSWGLRLAKDWKSLYEFTDPQDRGRVPESAYAESEGLIEYFDHELEWVEVIGDVGEIRVTYDTKLKDPSMSKMRGRKINLAEHWIKRNGEWYRDLLRNP